MTPETRFMRYDELRRRYPRIACLVEMAVCPRCGCTRSKDIHRPGYSCDYFVSRGHN